MAINFNKAEFVLSAVRAETFIRDGKPQVTFAGRSNVGKSSVINRLLGYEFTRGLEKITAVIVSFIALEMIMSGIKTYFFAGS